MGLKTKKLLLLICLIIYISTITGCTQNVTNVQSSTDTAKVESSKDSDEQLSYTTDTSTDPVDDNIYASLISLKQAMVGTSEIFAVAYLGCTEDMDEVNAIEWIKENRPLLCSDLPFLTAIPKDDIIGDGYGELYCIVPAYEDTTIAVNRISMNEDGTSTAGDVLYRSETGNPILVFCNTGGFAPDMQVVVTQDENKSITWYPTLDDNLRIIKTLSDEGENQVMDFTPYSEQLSTVYSQNKSDDWISPENNDLIGTAWDCDHYTSDGRVCKYSLSFEKDELFIQWNDGIDEEDHLFTATWNLITNSDVILLEIDLGQLDGIRQYPILLTQQSHLLEIFADFTSDDVHRSYETLNCIFERTYG